MTAGRRRRLGRRLSTLALAAAVLAGCGVGVQSRPEPLSRHQLEDAGGALSARPARLAAQFDAVTAGRR